MRRLRFLAPVAFVVAAACGKDAPSPSAVKGDDKPAAPAVDRSSPEVVLVAAHRALAAADLEALKPYLTDTGLRRLSGDLAAWRATIVDATPSGRAAPRVKLPDDPKEREAAQRALKSDDAGPLLRVYIQWEPRVPLPPPAAAPRDPAAARAELPMPAHNGESRLVEFVRGPDGWRIDRLRL